MFFGYRVAFVPSAALQLWLARALCAMLADAVKDEILRALKMDQVMVAHKELMLTLQKHKLVHRTRLLPDAVGPHPANRDGFGLSPRDCHNLLESILQVGFDSTQTSAVCVEVDDRSKLFTFCDNIVKNSGGSLPPWDAHLLKYGSRLRFPPQRSLALHCS